MLLMHLLVVHHGGALVGKARRRAQQRRALLALAREGHVRKGHAAEGLRVGVAAGMAGPEGLRRGGLARATGQGGDDGPGGVLLERVDLLVLRADLGQQEGAVAVDGGAGARRGGEARADRVWGGLDGRDGGVEGRGLGGGPDVARVGVVGQLQEGWVEREAHVGRGVRILDGWRGEGEVEADVGYQTVWWLAMLLRWLCCDGRYMRLTYADMAASD